MHYKGIWCCMKTIGFLIEIPLTTLLKSTVTVKHANVAIRSIYHS